MTQENLLFTRAFHTIQKAERILLIADADPDGDSIGSSGAILNWLLREGKQPDAFCLNPIPRQLHFIDNVSYYRNDPSLFKKPHDLIVTFDAGDIRRTGISDHLAENRPHVMVFDHHATNLRFGDTNIVIPSMSSTCELIHQFLEVNHIKIDDKMATALFAGLVFDTTFFINSATTDTSLESASKLLAAGARFTDITRHMAKNKTIPSLKLWGLAFSRLHYHQTLDLTSTYFLAKDLEEVPGQEETIKGISNFLSAICGTSDAILVLHETTDGYVRGSMRSLTRDVSKVAKLFGGGGHKKAAGFQIPGRLKVEGEKVRIIPV